ncbi:MAG: tetraacyldisaccharide 4'-kinase [Acidobacteria bacterium]|nr:tetraacyldisaccharide 4'-kinase [Acidobacteriota bacterium]
MGRKFFAFCGIGNPEAFLADLGQWGMEIVGAKSFPDHHKYTSEDRAAIEKSAVAAGARALICTDKDTFNLADLTFKALPLYVARISMQLNDEAGFWDRLYSIIQNKRGAAQP